MSGLIRPHGGTLVDRIADPAAECRVAAALAATIREGMLALARGS